MTTTTTKDGRTADEQTRLLEHDSEEAQIEYQDSPAIVTARNGGITIVIVTLLLLQGINISGLTVIQGAIATDLNALSKASWLISSYVIAASSTQPLLGRLCKIFSPRSCLFAATMFFSTGTIITAVAPSFAVFGTGRVFSGIGGGGIISCTIMIVLDLVSEKKRGLALGLVNTGFTVGVSLGAIICGALIKITGWRELFLMQAPFSIIAGVAVLFVIPKGMSATTDTQSTLELLKKVDYLGVVTLTAAIVLFLISLASTRVLFTPLLLSIPFAAVFLLVESRFASDPIIPMSVLKSRGALLSSLATAVLMLTRWSVLFYSPVYALAIREWAPSLAGTMLIPANLGFAIGGILVGWLHIREARSYYISCILVITLFVVTLFALSQLVDPTVPAAVFMAAIFANGLFTGGALNYTLVHALHLTAATNTFIVTSLLATFRGFGASFGSAIGGGIFSRGLEVTYIALRKSHHLPLDEDLLEQLLGSPGVVETLTGVDHEIALQSYVSGLSRLFLVMAVIGISAVALQAGTGWTAPPPVEEVDEE